MQPVTDPDEAADGLSEDSDAALAREEAEAQEDADAAVPAWIVRQIDRVERAETDRRPKARQPRAKAQAPSSSSGLPSRWVAASSRATGSGETPETGAASLGADATVPAPAPESLEPTAEAAREDTEDAHGPTGSAAARKRTNTERVISLASFAPGSLHWYPHSQNFVAICRQPGHIECRKTRTAKELAGSRRGRAGQGRPIGLLCQWLRSAGQFATKDEHSAPAVLQAFTHDQRTEARQLFMALPEAADFAACERAQASNEAEEPERVP